jgi:small subunit ribosomal protein S5
MNRRNQRNNRRPRQDYKARKKEEEFSALEAWQPRTSLGKQVKQGKITDISEVIDAGHRVQEPQIIDTLIPDLDIEFINIGQSKGKFGGGRRRIFRQTQKKTREGNKPIFSVMAIVGNKKGYVGVGIGKAKETLPAKEKAISKAKINMIKIPRGCGSWECGCGNPHSIPFKISAREGSVRITIMPAPKGIGLSVEDDLKKMLALAGIKDVWSKVKGQTKTKMNLTNAAFKALKQLSTMRVRKEDSNKVSYGEIK